MLAAEWTIQPTWMLPKLQMSLGESFLKNFLDKCPVNRMRVTYSENDIVEYGDPEFDGTPAELIVENKNLYIALLWSGDIGLGEAFVEKMWTSPNPTAVLEFFALNQNYNDDKGIGLSALGDILHRQLHKKRANSLSGSKRNISAHYDLSNDMYEEFLDKRMQYSCAYWETPEQSLEQAQINKMRRLLDSLEIEPGMSLLEVGSGWGYLARMAAEEYGAQVTSVTLSQEQLNYARHHVAEAGLSEQIEFRLQDYREVEGQFDRIISVEMIEAVGHENLGTYFNSLDSNLKEEGKVAIQVITVPDQKYDVYVKDCDWIQKYIFPGALCPSMGAMQKAMAQNSRFWIESTDNIGPHYARTLHEWRVKFEERWSTIKDMGFDENFRRVWNYYLHYCEAGYRSGILGNHQMVLSKTNRRVALSY